MITVYIHKLLAFSYLPILYPNLGNRVKNTAIFTKKAFQNFTEKFVEITRDIEKADFLLIPHDYPYIMHEKSYIDEFISLSDTYNKKIIVFYYGDYHEQPDIPNAIFFRTSQYKNKKLPNEIMMPAYAENLSKDKEISIRKKSEKPTVGFCGWAGLKNGKQKMKYVLKNLLIDMECFFQNEDRSVYKQGLFFRKKALNILLKSKHIISNFIIRKSYSGHAQTIDISPEVAREEFIQNIINSDFSLAIKGDGNYSDRFYEILSLGRIPVLVDTDCVLPFEDMINYDAFVLRVPYKEISNIDNIVTSFYNKLTEEKFTRMQKDAKKAFDTYLDISKFFQYVFIDNPNKFLN